MPSEQTSPTTQETNQPSTTNPTIPPHDLTELLTLYSLTAKILVKLLDFALTDTSYPALALDRARDLTHTLNVVPALDPALNPGLDHALFRTFDQASELALDYGDAVHLDVHLASELAHNLARELAGDLDRARTYYYKHAGLVINDNQTSSLTNKY